MAELTVFADAGAGFLRTQDTTDYEAARAGTGDSATVVTTSSIRVGQFLVGSYFVYEGFLNYDVSDLTGEASAATLSLWATGAAADQFTVEARARDWGDTLEDSDYVPGDDLSGLTLLASISTSGVSTAQYVELTSEAALVTAINAARDGDGILRLVLCSDKTTDGDAPTGSENIIFSSPEEAGTDQDPKLDITYTPAPPVVTTTTSPINIPLLLHRRAATRRRLARARR